MPTATIPASEAVLSLTGHDEMAIHAVTGRSFSDHAKVSELMLLRVLAAVWNTRETDGPGIKMSATQLRPHWDNALNMTTKEAGEFFADEPDDVMPEAPETEAGKAV
jgi:hypothetical protein